MQKMYLLLLVGSIALTSLAAQDGCSTFFPFKEGAEMTYGYYDKKGKLDSKSVHKVSELEESAEGTSATIQMTHYDDKDKEVNTGTFEVTCKDNVFSVDVTAMMAPEMTQAFSSMEFTVTGNDLEIPEKLTVGMELPEANSEIKVGSADMTLMTLNYSITDRKVEAKESVTTPAGTFDCFKIVSTFNAKSTLLNRTYHSVDWYAPGTAMVKQETYDKKGKLVSSTELLGLKVN